MTTTLGDTLLVFLADRPGTAYDLRQRHAQTFGERGAVDVLRVVAALKRLERLGHVRTGGSKTFTLTDTGHRRQRSWILDVSRDASGQDILDRVLLAMAATERETFDAVVASCLAVLESRRPRGGPRGPEPLVSAPRARAELDAVMAASALKWVRHLAGRPRERDAAA
ncbi:hypothetical protein [Actinoplanes siamensis]|uniref:Uncharacterized protein n=1 Tax=Actinoplanes siamensis TaxID=1223317 RepID=A0A919NDZ3_9ACTN|nr:hypothetical protein [Actinoplanes siamensis]GIF09062.1 hypothetical protein Asi03nite_66000 [Actinoplanes siamensis]